jgi:hypothetical protein
MYVPLLGESVFDEHIAGIFWGSTVLICTVPPAIYYYFRWKKCEIEAELKHEMIARGMSADEIVHVLGAKLASGAEANRSAGPINVTQHFGD